MTFMERIKKRVEVDANTGCWNFQGATRSGYAWLNYLGKNMSGSRAVMIETTGLHLGNPLMFACHNCNNRLCVNPEHLRWDTRSGNTKDTLTAGNHNFLTQDRSGPNHPMAILSENDIREIWSLRRTHGWGPVRIGRALGLNENTVNNILYNKTRWGHNHRK